MTLLEARVSVSKVQDTKSKDNSVMVTLKGTKQIVLQSRTGYEYEDTADIVVTVKVGSIAAAKAIGIDEYNNTRVLVLRDKDQDLPDLQAFEGKMEEPIPCTLDAYRGIVPDEALDNIENTIPERILKEIV